MFCDWPAAPAHAQDSWLCQSGTYFCDLSGDGGNCLQCRSDSDCTNPALPTYDPKRPFCDLTSGVVGYQSFCQQCVNNADCDGNPAGPTCNTNLPPADEPPPQIDILGFESCGGALPDCRQPGALPCLLNDTCNAADGICTHRSSSCVGDSECIGYFANQNVPAPHCFDGTCSVCDQETCQNDCSDDADCGDAGLNCLHPPSGSSFCGLSCAAPSAPQCPDNAPACDADSGFCAPCTSDDQCLNSTAPNCAPEGNCACTSDNQCPAGQVCLPRGTFGNCAFPVSGCTPETCYGIGFCDWQTGQCNRTGESPQCITDYDCATIYRSTGDFCVSGQCTQCRDNNDCVVAALDPGTNDRTFCCLAGDGCDWAPSGTCTEGCLSSADCLGSWLGPTCLLYSDGGGGECVQGACLSNADCAASSGSYCDLDGGDPYFAYYHYGTCACQTDADCPSPLMCRTSPGHASFCSLFCLQISDCAPGYICDPSNTCRPTCDQDGSVCPTTDPVCDTEDLEHQNGETLDGSIPSLEWCYACLTSSDCPNGEGCIYGQQRCAACVAPADCASGSCEKGTCLVACDAGACPNGLLCDTAADGHAGFCFECLSAIDCPDGEGCDIRTHRCGGCLGANACPPGDFCSLYWTEDGIPGTGACLQTCDVRSCPPDRPICAQLIALSNDHSFCFGCLSDSDCADAGTGAWCDTSVNQTFTCQLPLSH